MKAIEQYMHVVLFVMLSMSNNVSSFATTLKLPNDHFLRFLSAGVGRTGTFVTLDVMLQRISQEDSVDVFGFVRQMRYQRNFMVQTEVRVIHI